MSYQDSNYVGMLFLSSDLFYTLTQNHHIPLLLARKACKCDIQKEVDLQLYVNKALCGLDVIQIRNTQGAPGNLSYECTGKESNHALQQGMLASQLGSTVFHTIAKVC